MKYVTIPATAINTKEIIIIHRFFLFFMTVLLRQKVKGLYVINSMLKQRSCQSFDIKYVIHYILYIKNIYYQKMKYIKTIFSVVTILVLSTSLSYASEVKLNKEASYLEGDHISIDIDSGEETISGIYLVYSVSDGVEVTDISESDLGCMSFLSQFSDGKISISCLFSDTKVVKGQLGEFNVNKSDGYKIELVEADSEVGGGSLTKIDNLNVNWVNPTSENKTEDSSLNMNYVYALIGLTIVLIVTVIILAKNIKKKN